jgi:RNA polymerase sigma-70 factor (sigma-E family)
VEWLVASIIAAHNVGGAVAEAQFDDLFPELYRSGYRVAYRLLGSREDAADCAQEACARACLDWDKIVQVGRPLPWVVRVASNLALDRLRRDKRWRRQPATRAADIAGPEPTRVDLTAALAALPRRQREVVVLRHLADLSEADVATALGCSVGSVKTHASRGLAALRAVLTIDEDNA